MIRRLEIYQKILANNASETLAAYKSGLIYIEKGELEKAEKVADDLMTNFPKAGRWSPFEGIGEFLS